MADSHTPPGTSPADLGSGTDLMRREASTAFRDGATGSRGIRPTERMPPTRQGALLALALMVLAGASRIEWPGYVEESSGYQHPPLVLDLTGDAEEMTLAVTNSLVPTYTTPCCATLDLGEHRVGVVLDQKYGDTPDHVAIEPPAGFVAVPNDFLIEEGETVIVRIFRPNLS